MGKSIILSQINSRMPGRVTADSLSVGWFSGTSIRQFEMIDDQGKPVVRLKTIDTGITLLNALTGSVIDLKDVHVVGELPQLPGTTVDVKLIGTADLGKKLLNITADSTISAIDDKSKKGTVLTIKSGSKLSYGDEQNDAHLTLAYDLTQIQAIINASLPEGSILAGQRTKDFHITGALSKDPGLRAIRTINIDKTSIGFDRLYSKGFDMGKADPEFVMTGGVLTFTPTPIPANGGTVTVLGKVDFNQNPPAYIIEKQPAGNQLVKGVSLNKEITAGPLHFLPINWGPNGNLADVSGQLNIQVAEAYIPLDSVAYKTKGTFAGSLNISNLTTDAPFLQDITKNLGPVIKMTQPDLLSIKGGNIPDVPFNLKDGKVSYTNLRLGTNKVNLTFSGSVGLDTSLAMNMELTAQKINIPIPIALKGTTSKPELTITGTPGLGNGSPEDIGKTLQKEGPALLDQFMKKKK